MANIYHNNLTAEQINKINDMMHSLDDINEQPEEEQKEQTKIQKVMSWCKAHKKQLIFAGIAVAVVGGVIIMKRKGKKPIALDILDHMDSDDVDRIAPYRDLEFDPDNRWIDATTGEVLDDHTVFCDILERHKVELNDPKLKRDPAKVIINDTMLERTPIPEDFSFHSDEMIGKYANKIIDSPCLFNIGEGMYNTPIDVAREAMDVEAVKENVSKALDGIFERIDVNDIALMQIMTDLK
jgi:hypothetical protein